MDRPTTRGECIDGPRPCPWVGCRHHLGVEVTRFSSRPNEVIEIDAWDERDTCSLDVADRDESTLQAIGDLLGCTRERVRQIEIEAVKKIRRRFAMLGVTAENSGFIEFLMTKRAECDEIDRAADSDATKKGSCPHSLLDDMRHLDNNPLSMKFGNVWRGGMKRHEKKAAKATVDAALSKLRSEMDDE